MSQNTQTCLSGDLCIHPEGPCLPATSEFFYSRHKSKASLSSYCRPCQRERSNQWRINNPEKRKKQLDDWRKDNYERTLELNRQSSARNKSKIKKWHQDHKDQVNLKNRMVRAKKPDLYKAISRLASHRRRSRVRHVPSDFTIADWNFALDYFHGCCAVCGRQLNDLFGQCIASADHWIPLSSPDCPGTIPTNMVPLCHGLAGCNNRKTDKHPIEWLNSHFGKRHAKQIIERINTYFACVRDKGAK